MANNLVYRRALSILYSAGHSVSLGQHLRMELAGAPFTGSLINADDEARLNSRACDLLERHGYAPDRNSPIGQMLPFVGLCSHMFPKAGDLVEISHPWKSCKAGSELTLGSSSTPNRFQIGSAIAHMANDESVSLSGGPISVRTLPGYALINTHRTRERSFWRSHYQHAPGEAVSFTRTVAVWTWAADEADFDLPTFQRSAA